MKQSVRLRKSRSRRHGLKLPGGYRCKCCFVPEEAKAKEREICRKEIEGQLDAGDALFEIAVDTSYICPYCGVEDPPVDPNDPNEWQCCIRQRITEAEVA
jgi:hypothetical protein